MPPDQHHPQEVPMFDVVMGAVVPTLSTLAEESTTAAHACECGTLVLAGETTCTWCGR